MSSKDGVQACTVAPVAGLRLHIWQIDRSMHCSVLGTCLSLRDLYAIARRARWHLDPAATAHQVHSWFVDRMVQQNDLSRLVDKMLEKRHGGAMQIRRARTTDEILARWKEVAGRGQIASAYWMAMSHPLATRQLREKLFGEIHMLSHLLGASRREELSRLHDLEVANASLEASLAQLKQLHRAALKDKKAIDDEVANQKRARDQAEVRLSVAAAKIAALEAGAFTAELERRLSELEARAASAEARACLAERGWSAARGLLEEVRAREAAAVERARELAAENDALESELARAFVCPLAQSNVAAGGSDALCGKRILCVGGRSNLVPHYRALVERRGGELLHHDGGIEESLDAVTRSLATVDAVVCPVDCVSHAAWFKVKRACKHMAKPFVVLRTSGLSSFARGIQALAAPAREKMPIPEAL